MEFSDRGIKLLAQLEGFKAEPYKDSGGKWTIGDGTLDPVDDNGKPIIQEVTKDGAMTLLLSKVQPLVATLNSWIKVPVNQNQFDALVCLGYNIGSWAITNSTLMRYLNQALYSSAADEFLKWCKVDREVVPGLLARRQKEQVLFLEK